MFAGSIILFGRRFMMLLILCAIFFSVLLTFASNVRTLKTFFDDRFDLQPGQQTVLNADDLSAQKNLRMLIAMTGILLVVSGYVVFIRVVSKEVESRGRLEREFEIARDIQKSLLPAGAFVNDWCEVVGLTVPATEIGGDYFDVITLSGDEVLVFVADVSGHGVGAGLIAAMFKSALYAHLESRPSLSEMLAKMNRTIFQLSDKQVFVTAACVHLDWRSRMAHLATAGHLPILYRGANGILKSIRTPALSIGLRRGAHFSDTQILISPGDRFLLYTDGLVEAHRRDGEEFGEVRLQQTWQTLSINAGDGNGGRLLQAVRAFTGQDAMADDATIAEVRLL